MLYRTLILLPLTALLLTAPPRLAQAQAARAGNQLPQDNKNEYEESLVDAPKPKVKWAPPIKFREELKQDDYRKAALARERQGVVVKSTPMLAPNGERLVGVIADRTMTQPQLQARARLMLDHTPKIGDKEKDEDRRVVYESRILADWAKMTTLAVEAEHEGYKVNGDELNKAMQDLSSQSQDTTQKATQAMQMIGIPEGDLRQELSDGLLVEKMVRDRVDKTPDNLLLPLFQKHPEAFLRPTQVNAWQLFIPMDKNSTRKQLSQAQDEFEKLTKRLRKCGKDADYQALQKEIAARPENTIVLSYLENVANNDAMPAPVLSELFKLDPGDTSKPIASPLGLHAVKVITRTEGHKNTFEEAKPQIKNYLFEVVKDTLYEEIKGQIDVKISASGLSNYTEIKRPDAAPAEGAAETSEAPPGTARPGVKPATGRAARSMAAPDASTEPGAIPSVESVVGTPAETLSEAAAATEAAAPAGKAAGKATGKTAIPAQQEAATTDESNTPDPAGPKSQASPIGQADPISQAGSTGQTDEMNAAAAQGLNGDAPAPVLKPVKLAKPAGAAIKKKTPPAATNPPETGVLAYDPASGSPDAAPAATTATQSVLPLSKPLPAPVKRAPRPATDLSKGLPSVDDVLRRNRRM